MNKITEAESDEVLRIIKEENLARGSRAYTASAVQRMTAEANDFSHRLKLVGKQPIEPSDIQKFFVSPPWFSKIEDINIASATVRLRSAKFVIAGFIQTTNWCFYFREGRLWDVANREIHDEQFDQYRAWAAKDSLINSTEAALLASQKLAAVGVEVAKLDKLNRSVEQAYFWDPPGTTNKTLLPIFTVTWGNDVANPAAQVQFFGVTKELMTLHIGDFSLWQRRLLALTNTLELLHIPDPQVRSLNELKTNPPTGATNTVRR